MGKRNKTKTVWLWTRGGGQLGIAPENIQVFNQDYVRDRSGNRYELDPDKWVQNMRNRFREFP